MVVGPHRGPFRGPQNRARLIGVTSPRVSDISAFDISWFNPLSEPAAYQVEPGLSAAWTQYTSGAALPRIFPDTWHQSLAEPQRRRDMPVADQAPWFAIDTRTPADPTKTFWYSWLSEPQRRRDIPTANQPWTFTIDTRTPANPATTFWFGWLSEPQRRKDIPQSNQPWNFTMDWRWSAPTPAVVPAFFYSWLSEPVRRKPELQPALQQSFTMDWKWSAAVPGTFTYSFALAERGDSGTLVISPR
jgi:hypothetical protein